MKNRILSLFAVLSLTALNIAPAQNEPDKVDAVTGATHDKATLLNVTKEEGVNMVYDYLKDSGPFYFATIENDAPRVRPIGIILKYDGKIWFHVGKHKASFKQILKNPNVEISCTSAKGKFYRVTGKAVCENNKTLDEMTFKDYPMLKKSYNEQTGLTLGHFYISNGVAEIPTDSGTVIIKF
jgi:uncharacterized pyridoxamine 5'-phosphate oxidase family protein